MQSKPKSNSVITSKLDEAGVLVFTVRGAGPDGADATLSLDPKSMHEKNRERAMIHGLVQKVSDRAALSRNTVNFKPATPAEKLAAMRVLVDHLASGSEEWSPTRASAVPKGPTLDPILVAAVVEATGRLDSEVREMIAKGAGKKSVTPAVYLAALANAAAVRPIVERLRAEQASRLDVDGDELLSEAMGDEEGEDGEGA